MTQPEDDQFLTARRPRLTQDQRSEATREKLIASAIKCLHTHGYAATTTSLIADNAGVSRGALQHQFGARIDLMIAVAEAALEQRAAIARRGLARFEAGKGRFIGLTEIDWETTDKPATVALIEIVMACRSDLELRARFAALAGRYSAAQREDAWAVASCAGVTDRPLAEAMGQLHRAALLGLTLQAMFWRDKRTITPALELLRWYKGLMTERLLAAPGQEAQAIATYLHEVPTRSVVHDLDASSFSVSGGPPARVVHASPPRKLDPRGKETRLKTIQAAISCLCDYGYAETTTLRVADIADISRGAMQQQFPTRRDLLLGVLEHIIEEHAAAFDAGIDETLPARDRFIAITNVLWGMYSRPSGIAIFELVLASRSDPVLNERCRALTMQISSEDTRTWRAAQAAGIKDQGAVTAMRILHRAALRGLAVMRMLAPDPEMVKPSLELLYWYKTVLTDHLINTANK